MKISLTITLIALTLGLGQSYAQTVDQSQTVYTEYYTHPDSIFQSFTCGIDGELSAVRLHLKESITGAGVVRVQIIDDSIPSSNAILADTAVALPSTGQWVEISFDSNPSLISGAQYGIRVLSLAGSIFDISINANDVYSGGTMYSHPPAALPWFDQQRDIAFETIMVEDSSSTSLNEQIPYKLSLFPNPTNEIINITNGEIAIDDFILFSLSGENVTHLVSLDQFQPDMIQLNLSKLSRG